MRRLAQRLGDAAFGGLVLVVVLMGVSLLCVLALIAYFLLGGGDFEMPMPGD